MGKGFLRSWLSIIATISLVAALAPGAAAQHKQERGDLVTAPNPGWASESRIGSVAAPRCLVLAIVPPGAEVRADEGPVVPGCESPDAGAESLSQSLGAGGDAASHSAAEGTSGAYQRPGETERVSVGSDGTQGNGGTGFFSAISANGRYVAFHSGASNLVPGDTNDADDVFPPRPRHRNY